MRRIEKGPAPACLSDLQREQTRLRRESGQPPATTDWAPGDCAQSIRDRLLEDQRGICAYCMQRIERHGHRDGDKPRGNGGMRIEHIVPREISPGQMYDWSNLLGVCGGRFEWATGDVEEHCDRARGTAELSVDPTRPSTLPEGMFSYERAEHSQALLIVSADPQAKATINRLNLNAPSLARARRDVERDLGKRLERRGWRPADIRRALESASQPDAQGRLPAFAPVAVRYLSQRLRRAEGGRE